MVGVLFSLPCPLPPLPHLPAAALGCVRVTSRAHIIRPEPSIQKVKSTKQLQLLHKLVHSHPHSPVGDLPDAVTYGVGSLEVDKIALEVQRLKRVARPWWRRPSPTW